MKLVARLFIAVFFLSISFTVLAKEDPANPILINNINKKQLRTFRLHIVGQNYSSFNHLVQNIPDELKDLIDTIFERSLNQIEKDFSSTFQLLDYEGVIDDLFIRSLFKEKKVNKLFIVEDYRKDLVSNRLSISWVSTAFKPQMHLLASLKFYIHELTLKKGKIKIKKRFMIESDGRVSNIFPKSCMPVLTEEEKAIVKSRFDSDKLVYDADMQRYLETVEESISEELEGLQQPYLIPLEPRLAEYFVSNSRFESYSKEALDCLSPFFDKVKNIPLYITDLDVDVESELFDY